MQQRQSMPNGIYRNTYRNTARYNSNGVRNENQTACQYSQGTSRNTAMGNNNRGDFLCHFCQQPGHFRRECPDLHLQLIRKQRANEEETTFKRNIGAFVLLTLIKEMTIKGKFVR